LRCSWWSKSFDLCYHVRGHMLLEISWTA
jgi:hypothetical protein